MSAARPRWVALMPLRAGSRSIPMKNLRNIAGRPLFAWALEQAVVSGCFDEICICSDSAEIRARAEALFGDTVTVLDRTAASAADEAATEVAMLEVADRIPFDAMALVQATSPLTRAGDFVAARHRFQAERLDSLVSAVPSRRFVWSAHGEPLNYHPAERPRRQDMAPSYVENGAFYFTRRSLLLSQRCRLGGHIGIHPMAPETVAELDEPEDWATVERHLGRRLAREALSHLEVLVVDVDGTLTDGGMYYDASGESLKKFDTRDAKGLALVADAGIRVCVISTERSAVVDARMRKLGIDDYFSGVEDKWALLERLLAEWGVAAAATGYVGDDLGDLNAMAHSGFSFCPADAVPAVRDRADYRCSAAGGHGAVREVCELVLGGRG